MSRGVADDRAELLADRLRGRETSNVVSRFFASEFPNDNAELHLGTIWMSEEPCGPVEPHLPEPAAEDDDEPIEIVETIEIEGPFENVPPPLESGEVATLVVPEINAEQSVVEVEEPVSANENGVPLQSTPPPPMENDPYVVFLRTLSEAAAAAGDVVEVAAIEAALAEDAVAIAWAAILRGESEDFSRCAATLDEWASGALAKVVGAPQKAAMLRRELRARGVAAFGLVEAA
jgi:hypothetical protein